MSVKLDLTSQQLNNRQFQQNFVLSYRRCKMRKCLRGFFLKRGVIYVKEVLTQIQGWLFLCTYLGYHPFLIKYLVEMLLRKIENLWLRLSALHLLIPYHCLGSPQEMHYRSSNLLQYHFLQRLWKLTKRIECLHMLGIINLIQQSNLILCHK